MRILYLLSQKPGCTGSGFYTQSMIREAKSLGHETWLVAAVEKGEESSFQGPWKKNVSFVRFGTRDLTFPIPGMSDGMPYRSTRFMDLGEGQLHALEKAFRVAISEAVLTFRPDVIHGNHLWLMASLVKDLFPTIPLVITSHGTDLRQFENCPHLRQKVIGCGRADAVIALTQTQKKEISFLYRIPEERIHVIGTGYNAQCFYPAPKPDLPPVRLLYAGKISFAKGVFWLLSAIKILNDISLPFHLSLAGSGSGDEYDACVRLAGSMKKNVSWLGMLNQTELAARMREAHMFILPSFFEGQPLVLLEALASGCRIITTKLPGTEALFVGLHGHAIRMIELPPLQTIDRPHERDVPALVHNLADVINDEVHACYEGLDPPDDTLAEAMQCHTWGALFRRVQFLYEQVRTEPAVHGDLCVFSMEKP
ncbi:glycosyltransferase family 4 protein [Desulfobotulus sp. H1]|uniref:Glycosyltransferase family 4 protein n=1 Tax=Desulfobotulus pelophilus TaxID=2823377 RepID=A0ABT3NA73_9BACT|nr:glycosyltransferase family 4 protein [Desulfobotulus pelophilus]MCW7754362.1 glycosyltransferase family 4 protein [Desulfobotulus pelophilus]